MDAWGAPADVHTEPHWDLAALITIDTQVDFTSSGAPAEIPGTREVLPAMAGLVQAFRRAGKPIVHVVRLYLPDGSNAELCRRSRISGGRPIVAPGTEGSQMVPDIRPEPGALLDAGALLRGEFQFLGPNEYAMYKPRWGAFYRTDLEGFLRRRGIDTLVFAGCNLPNCPRTSMYEAGERDFRLVLATDAMSGLYERGLDEIRGIGVLPLTTDQILALILPAEVQ